MARIIYTLLQEKKLFVMIGFILIAIYLFYQICRKADEKQEPKNYFSWFFLSSFIVYLLLVDAGINFFIFSMNNLKSDFFEKYILLSCFIVYALYFYYNTLKIAVTIPGSLWLNYFLLPFTPLFSYLFPIFIFFQSDSFMVYLDEQYKDELFSFVMTFTEIVCFFTIPWWIYFIISPKVRRQWKKFDNVAK